jgi:hypothetical protein
MTPAARRLAQKRLDAYLALRRIEREEQRKKTARARHEAGRRARLGVATPRELELLTPRRFPDRLEARTDAPWSPAR